MNEIRVFKEGGRWVCLFMGPQADAIRREFGTAILPSSFLVAANPHMVLSRIQKLNPDCLVTMALDDYDR